MALYRSVYLCIILLNLTVALVVTCQCGLSSLLPPSCSSSSSSLSSSFSRSSSFSSSWVRRTLQATCRPGQHCVQRGRRYGHSCSSRTGICCGQPDAAANPRRPPSPPPSYLMNPKTIRDYLRLYGITLRPQCQKRYLWSS